MDPAASVLHYAQAVFDGSKAYRSKDGTIRLFRPRKHAERLNISCERLCIPLLDVELVLESFNKLIEVDHAWVPSKPGTSLYLRPTVIASEAFLGVRPSKRYTYFLILSPVGPYYAEGMNPVKILATDEYVRAVRAAPVPPRPPPTTPPASMAPRSRRRPAIPRCCGSTACTTNISTRSGP
jgi:branched-chain amino acid aminotransferase